MSDNYLLGIDIGTQGTKTSLVSVEGQVIADAFESSNLIRPGKGMVQQDPDEIFASVINTIREVMMKSGVKPSEVISIGIDGQMAGIMGIDKDWNAATYYDSWLDTRCEKYIAKMKAEAEEKVISITGCPVTYAHGPKILWWKHEHPGTYKKIDKFVLPSAYVAGRLAAIKAENAYIDYSHLHFSGFGDVERNRWSQELLEIFHVERNKMPQIVEPWKIIGGLSEEAAKACNLISGIPIVAGCGDSAATSLGAGINKKGLVFDVAGTASVFSCCVDKYSPDVKNKTLIFPRSIIPGLWTPLAYINGGGLCLKWFRDNLTDKGTNVSYRDLDKATEKIPPGSEDLIFSPHFSGRVCPNNPHIRGSWLGLTWIHTRDHMYRAVMESIAYEYNYYLKVAKELIKDATFTDVITIGGGAKSHQFNAIKADVLGIKYSTKTINDTATIGSVIVAGYGVKAFTSLEEASGKFGVIASEVEPELENHKAYNKFSHVYEKTLEALGSIYQLLLDQ